MDLFMHKFLHELLKPQHIFYSVCIRSLYMFKYLQDDLEDVEEDNEQQDDDNLKNTSVVQNCEAR